MKVLSLHQPWATLIALGVKTIETRSWRAPASLSGERIAIHAAGKPVKDGTRVGDWVVTRDADDVRWQFLVDWPKNATLDPSKPWRFLHLGAIVATAVLADCVPMYCPVPVGAEPPYIHIYGDGVVGLATPNDPICEWWPDDQKAYGDFAPGRYAWILGDIAALDVPVPFRGGQGLSRSWEPS